MASSRRAWMKTSGLAAVALCAGEMWAQGERPCRQGRQGGTVFVPLFTYLPDFSDMLGLSRDYTIECALAMPESRYGFRPAQEVRTFGQHMVHIAESVRGVYEVFVEGKAGPTNALSEAGQEQVRSRAEVLSQLRQSFDYVGGAVGKLSEFELGQRVSFLGNRQIARWRVLDFILDHTTHHRGQTVVYLRMNGVRPPTYRA